jgi:hypothetical protein
MNDLKDTDAPRLEKSSTATEAPMFVHPNMDKEEPTLAKLLNEIEAPI